MLLLSDCLETFCRGPARSDVTRLLRLLAAGGFWLTVSVGTASAQDTQPATGSERPFEISDNSFLVEEALNQEPGVFQNIVNLYIVGWGEWATTFTQEWPLFSRTHQISFTIPYVATGSATGLGDAFIHYRLQAVDGSGAFPAFSPRLSLVVPSGNSSRGLGYGNPGWQVNLPFSKQVRDLYLHWNVGFTHFPSVEIDDAEYNLFTPHVAASGIWRAKPMVNLMLEGVVQWDDQVEAGVAERRTSFILIPGVRTGWNVGDTQTIVGFGLPIQFTDAATDAGVFLYLSYELPFARR